MARRIGAARLPQRTGSGNCIPDANAGDDTQLSLFTAASRDERWRVRTSTRARRLSVRVFPGGSVEIVVPPRVSAGRVRQFVTEHRDWIERRVHEFEQSVVPGDCIPEVLELPGVGQRHRVIYDDAPHRPRVSAIAPDTLRVVGDRSDAAAVACALRRWLIAASRPSIVAALDELVAATGLEYRDVQLRRQRTRWGSCSVRGTISVNVCLAFLRPEVVRYLLLHELCHTRHMNHSRRFWCLVEQHEPQYRMLDRELSAAWRQVPGWVFR